MNKACDSFDTEIYGNNVVHSEECIEAQHHELIHNTPINSLALLLCFLLPVFPSGNTFCLGFNVFSYELTASHYCNVLRKK